MTSEREHPGQRIRAAPWSAQSLQLACAEHGEDVVIDWCVELLTGQVPAEDAFGPELSPKLRWVAGPSLGGWKELDPVNFYWVRVWAARAFLYVWRDDVVDALLAVADDPAWR